MPPFLPFLEALGRYIRANSQDQLRAQVALMPQILASLLPELSVYFPDHLDSLPVPPEQARFRLYEAIGTFLEVISGQHVLVLILDDDKLDAAVFLLAFGCRVGGDGARLSVAMRFEPRGRYVMLDEPALHRTRAADR